MTRYYRPILQMFGPIPAGAYHIGWCWFDRVEVLARNGAPQIVAARDIPAAAPGPPDRPAGANCRAAPDHPAHHGHPQRDPDSFSDGGLFNAPMPPAPSAGHGAGGGRHHRHRRRKHAARRANRRPRRRNRPHRSCDRGDPGAESTCRSRSTPAKPTSPARRSTAGAH